MSYCFLRYTPGRDGGPGRSPDCPDRIAFNLLAGPGGFDWGIFDVDEEREWSPQDPVSEELAKLIESAKRYPPALALARGEMEQVFGEQQPSQAEFARAYGVALQVHLRRQHESSYVLAPALKDQPGNLTKGEWYWVLHVSGTPPVAAWVSDDFHVYKNDMDDFDLTGMQLKKLGFSA